MIQTDIENADDMQPAFALIREQLDADRPRITSSSMAIIAQRKHHYRRLMIRLGIPAAVAGILLVAALLMKVVVPEASRLLQPPPPVVVGTFSVSCITPAQAANLLRPYLPRPKNPRWQAEDFDVVAGPPGVNVVTVRAPQELIDRVPRLLTQFQQQAGCPMP
jgi:hypothetical protein